MQRGHVELLRCQCLQSLITSVVPELTKLSLQVINEVDIIVISHPDLAHLGALPYLVGRLKLQAPVYATAPCHKMGQMFMYDQFLSRQLSSDFTAFSLDDVDAAFQGMRHVKFQQQVQLSGSLLLGFWTVVFIEDLTMTGMIWESFRFVCRE